MGADAFEKTDWAQLSGFVAGAMGLHFPEERWPDLQRGLTAAAGDFGFADVTACARWLLSGPLTRRQSEVLASHLTIGETYFFREPRAFEVLAQEVLPAFIHARRGREQRLRLWSAACCSGEEAYSLAMLLHQVLPDIQNWQIKILATDINPRFLRRATAGSYTDWSFRNAPPGLKERYFIRQESNRYEVIPEIKAMVTFAHLNLAEDGYPSLATETNAMDLIFCRNVLMYFKVAQIERVVAGLHHSLVDDGWLVVSPSETSQALFSRFTTRNFPGAIFYQKGAPSPKTSSSFPRSGSAATSPVATTARKSAAKSKPPAAGTRTSPDSQSIGKILAEADALYEEGQYGEAAEVLLKVIEQPSPDSRLFSRLARALANQGKLDEALLWCDRWISADKIDPAGHYLRAVILLERGDNAGARVALQRAIFLSPTFVVAHFALGNLALVAGNSREATRHFNNVRQLLSRLRPEEALPESDGLTAGRLTETVAAFFAMEVAS